MPGTGTIINVLAILVGGLIGLVVKQRMNTRLQQALILAAGLATLFIGIEGALEKMFVIGEDGLSSQGTMMIVSSLALGALVGELLDIEGRLEGFGCWLREKSGNSGDTGFVNAFLTASFTVCIGAMAIVGSIQDGMLGDYSTLMMKAVLDFMIIMVMAASMGKGCVFSAIPVGIFQGSITALSTVIAPFMTDGALQAISLIGSMLIFCVGVNLIWDKRFKVANMLPAILFAALWGALG